MNSPTMMPAITILFFEFSFSHHMPFRHSPIRIISDWVHWPEYFLFTNDVYPVTGTFNYIHLESFPILGREYRYELLFVFWE
jgi:hypothetical protein